MEALLREVVLPTLPPIVLPAVEPRDPPLNCTHWVMKRTAAAGFLQTTTATTSKSCASRP